MATWGIILVLLAEMCFLGGVSGLEWDNVPDDYVYACAGSKVTLPWHFKLGEGETVVGVNWMHDGSMTSTMVATMVRGHFVATGPYSARVQHVDNGGVVVEDLQADDSGNYTVEVNVAVGGLFQAFRKTIHLQVADGLMLQGELTVEQDPEAWWDQTSQQWFLHLTCGVFTFLGSPPVDVEWITPDGQTKVSSGYESGNFYLSVNTPVRGGNYTCTIPPVRLPDLCYKENVNQNRPTLSASVMVNEMKARMSLLEANQKSLREANERLQTNQKTLLADSAQLQEKLQSLEQSHEQDMQNVTEHCHVVTVNLEEQMDRMQSVQQSLKDKVEFLYNKTRHAPLTGPCRSDQHTVLDDAWRSTSEEQSQLKCDKNLEPGWYRFFLNGANAAMPTTCVPKNHCSTHAPQWLDLQGETMPGIGEEKTGRACAHWSSSCCHWESPITVRNCGDYFVYKLQPRVDCHLAYCVENQN